MNFLCHFMNFYNEGELPIQKPLSIFGSLNLMYREQSKLGQKKQQ